MLAAILVGIIGFELRESALGEAPAPAALVGEQQLGTSPASAPSTMPSDQAARHVATILARPLFSPTRRPDDVPAHDTAKNLARLTGMIVSPAGKSAIFAANSAGGKPVVVGEGGRIGEYVISSIDVGAVVITGPAGQRILHPAFDPSPPPPKPVTPKPIVAPTVAPMPAVPGQPLQR